MARIISSLTSIGAVGVSDSGKQVAAAGYRACSISAPIWSLQRSGGNTTAD